MKILTGKFQIKLHLGVFFPGNTWCANIMSPKKAAVMTYRSCLLSFFTVFAESSLEILSSLPLCIWHQWRDVFRAEIVVQKAPPARLLELENTWWFSESRNVHDCRKTAGMFSIWGRTILDVEHISPGSPKLRVMVYHRFPKSPLRPCH